MSGQSSRELDFDDALEGVPAPPLEFADGSFEVIQARSAFTRTAEGWAEWLLEARRLLAGEGLLVVGLAEPADFERLTGQQWDDSSVGMTVLRTLDDAGSELIFHSEWWLRAHWGRAFRVQVEERDGRRAATLRKQGPEISAEDLVRPEHGDDRELTAATANVEYLRLQLDAAERSHRHKLEEQREDMNRELMRRSYAAADLDWARRGPLATLVAAEYEATTSWRLTKPLRAAGKMLRRGR
jgi:hypothetical protein